MEELEKELRAGNDALYMSDQGTPGLADPGRDLVEVAIKIGAKLRVVPGPSSRRWRYESRQDEFKALWRDVGQYMKNRVHLNN